MGLFRRSNSRTNTMYQTIVLEECSVGDALLHLGRIATATGAVLYCENAFARLDRGAGLPVLQRLPYFPQDAMTTLNKYDMLVIVDVRRPVANFGYEGGPSQLVELQVRLRTANLSPTVNHRAFICQNMPCLRWAPAF